MYNISMVTVDKFEYCSHEWVGFSQNNSHDKNFMCVCGFLPRYGGGGDALCRIL
mgnify:CR=1 FL=1